MDVETPEKQDLPFPSDVVGTRSYQGFKGIANPRQPNQDRGSVCYPIGPNGDMALFCVYDGHGTPPLSTPAPAPAPAPSPPFPALPPPHERRILRATTAPSPARRSMSPRAARAWQANTATKSPTS